MKVRRALRFRETSPRGPASGFTLAEVLVTLLIMAGILVSVTQILHTARVSRDTIHNIQETQLAGPAIMDMIERDLAGLMIYNRTKKDHLRVKNRVMLGVDADSIDFVTSTDSRVVRYDGDRYLRTPVNEVGYRLRPNPEYDDFLELYRREDAGVDDQPFEGGEFSFLHDRVKNFDIQVYAEDGPDAEPLENWGVDDDENIGVPARLEISLTLELARRIEREALMQAPAYLTEVTYRRVIRPAESLRIDEESIVVPLIPGPPTGTGDSAGGGGGDENLMPTASGGDGGGSRGGGGGGGKTTTTTTSKGSSGIVGG